MIIKKFQGKTKEEALECAKKELGEGIVEMNVKTIFVSLAMITMSNEQKNATKKLIQASIILTLTIVLLALIIAPSLLYSVSM